MLINIGLINSQFNRWETVRKSPWRWFGLHLGFKGILMSCILMKQRLFIGFSNYHIEQAFLKSIIADAWNRIPAFLGNSNTRFREDLKPNQYLFRYWQFAKNAFYPKKRKGIFFPLWKSELEKIEKSLIEEKYTSVCINDMPLTTDDDFNFIKHYIQKIFEKKFPIKSSFEI